MNKLKSAWEEGCTTLNGWLMLPGAPVVEAMATQPWDSLTIDLQHGLMGEKDALNMLVAMDAAEVVSLVRVAGLDHAQIGRMLDWGARGVICPVVNTAEDASELVRSMRYPPVGSRSVGPLRPIFRQGPSYVASANDDCLAIAQIETAAAMENLEGILQVEGLDAVYIGPADLAMDMGYAPMPETQEPAMLDAFAHILDTARRYDVAVGMHCMSPEYAKQMQAMGFEMLTAGVDFTLLIGGSAMVIGMLAD